MCSVFRACSAHSFCCCGSIKGISYLALSCLHPWACVLVLGEKDLYFAATMEAQKEVKPESLKYLSVELLYRRRPPSPGGGGGGGESGIKSHSSSSSFHQKNNLWRRTAALSASHVKHVEESWCLPLGAERIIQDDKLRLESSRSADRTQP